MLSIGSINLKVFLLQYTKLRLLFFPESTECNLQHALVDIVKFKDLA